MNPPLGFGVAAHTHPGTSEHLHWETALDRLELDVMLAERTLADPSRDRQIAEPWDEPTLAGPIPADLVERALEIRDRQLQVEAELVRAVGAARCQHRFADRVDRATGRGTGRAVYLDIEA